MSLDELFRDLDPQIAGPLQRITEALRAEIGTQLDGVRKDVQRLVGVEERDESSAPAASAEQLDALEELKHAAASIDRATRQASLLTALLEGAGRFSSRSAFVLIRDDGQRCWGSLGFDDAGRNMEGAPVDVPNGDSVWSRIQDGTGTRGLSADDCAAFCSQFEAATPRVGALLPLSLGDHVAGYLYADQVGEGPLNITALQLLTFVAGQTLETLPVRKRSSTPTLVVADAAAPAAVPVAEPEAAEEVGAIGLEPEAIPVQVTEDIPVGFEPEPIEAELEVAEPEVVEAEPEVVEPEAAEAEPGFAEPETFEAEPESSAPEAVEAEPPPPEAEVTEPERAPDFYEVEPPAAEAQPVEEQKEEAPGGVEREEAEPPPTPPALPTSGSSTQVLPPADVRGPGWAFTAKETTDDTGNEALHEEARRLARLLVTEIKLYNEEQVDQGRRSGDIYRRLQEDIDRSRQIFEDRIDEQIRSDNDYFRDALIRILAGGDESLLGS